MFKLKLERVLIEIQRLPKTLYFAYGRFILWSLRPGLAPLVKELSDEQEDIKSHIRDIERMVNYRPSPNRKKRKRR